MYRCVNSLSCFSLLAVMLRLICGDCFICCSIVKPVSVRPILEIGHDALLEPMTVVDLLKA